MTDKVCCISHGVADTSNNQFSSLLSETINAPRLSGSKVKILTELFTTSLDVSHITTFYKLNRSLPQGGQARISSLYIFDALSRGAKEGLKGKKKVEAKRCLDALEAVAESWIEGMTTSGGQAWAEGKVSYIHRLKRGEKLMEKDKARKIIDIWRKYEIFPPDTVDQLSMRLTNTPLPVASGSRSTTPTYEPGGPPPISPALPPLDMKGDVPGIKMKENEKRSTGEGKFPSPTSLCVFQRRRISRNQEEEQNVDKVILNTTNLRYIILSPNTIHCSQFPTKRQKQKHASLRCTIHLHLHRTSRGTLHLRSWILDFG
jgi:hypothetical protein